MGGSNKKKTIPINRLGTTIKNFDFSFCDFIKHPIANKISDKISSETNIIRVILNTTNRAEDTIFSKLFI